MYRRDCQPRRIFCFRFPSSLTQHGQTALDPHVAAHESEKSRGSHLDYTTRVDGSARWIPEIFLRYLAAPRHIGADSVLRGHFLCVK
jgi:hypothetical protein